jgi:two-component system nitrogen regulation response regulator GlnG
MSTCRLFASGRAIFPFWSIVSSKKAVHQLLKTYSFPGNVRELQALVFDGVARHQGVTLSLASFKEAISGEPQSTLTMEQAEGARATPLASLFPDRLPTLREAEDHLITEALLRADGNQTVAAGLLGLSRQALNKRLSRRRGSDSPADRNGESDQADRMSQR